MHHQVVQQIAHSQQLYQCGCLGHCEGQQQQQRSSGWSHFANLVLFVLLRWSSIS
jgi:hypothetical protein